METTYSYSKCAIIQHTTQLLKYHESYRQVILLLRKRMAIWSGKQRNIRQKSTTWKPKVDAIGPTLTCFLISIAELNLLRSYQVRLNREKTICFNISVFVVQFHDRYIETLWSWSCLRWGIRTFRRLVQTYHSVVGMRASPVNTLGWVSSELN